MSPRPSTPESFPRRFAATRRRPFGWLATGALLAFAPKCLLCLLAYMGLGAALGLGGPEICGAPNDPTVHWPTWLSTLSLVALVIAFFAHGQRRRA